MWPPCWSTAWAGRLKRCRPRLPRLSSPWLLLPKPPLPNPSWADASAVSNLGVLQEALGYVFRDESLLRLALTHPSIAHESASAAPHNQRLEFLGDAVLGIVLTRELYEKFPDFGEGPLTKARAQMVNRRAP